MREVNRLQNFILPGYKVVLLAFLLSVGYCNLAYAGNQREEYLSVEVQASLHAAIINPVQPHLAFASDEEADAWLMDMSNRLKKWVPDDFMRKRLLTIIQYEAVRAGLDPQLVLSVITVESKFNKYAISDRGALGIMQIMPFWRDLIGMSNQNLLSLQTNIRFGCTILRHYLQLENGDWYYALGRYNGSRGQSTYPALVFAAYNKYWQPATVMMISKAGEVKYINYADGSSS